MEKLEKTEVTIPSDRFCLKTLGLLIDFLLDKKSEITNDVIEAGGVEKNCVYVIHKWNSLVSDIIKQSSSEANLNIQSLEEFLVTCQDIALEGGSYELIDLIREFEKSFLLFNIEIAKK